MSGGVNFVWVTVQDDTGCDPIPAPYTASIGVRWITNRSALGASCVQPTLSSPECLYVVHRAPNPGAQLNPLLPLPGDGDPVSVGDVRRWASRLAVARGPSDRIAISMQAYRDTAGGGPCTASSVRCRSDTLFATRSTSNGWCTAGVGCRWTNVQYPQMYMANWDNTPISNLPWVDHILPATMVFDYDFIANSWYDFRGDPVNDKVYQVRQSFIRHSTGDSLLEAQEYPASLMTGTYNGDGVGVGDTGVWYGDIDTVSRSRLHAFVARQVSVGGASNLIGYTWGPYADLVF